MVQLRLYFLNADGSGFEVLTEDFFGGSAAMEATIAAAGWVEEPEYIGCSIVRQENLATHSDFNAVAALLAVA